MLVVKLFALLVFVFATGFSHGASQVAVSQNLVAQKVQKTEPVKETAKPSDGHSVDKLDIDRKLAEYTRQLAVYTEQLAVYTKDVSRFTLWLFIATAVLACIAIWQGVQLKRTVDLGRQEFISAHRPKLIVRCVFTLDMIPEPLGKPVRMYFVIANVGNSIATIEQSAFQIEHVTTANPRLRIPLPTEGNNFIGPKEIEAGSEHPNTFPSDTITWDNNMLHPSDVSSYINKKEGLFFTGHIIYKDSSGVRRHTVFRRKYLSSIEFLRPVDDSEQEYAD
jgi:hypothetical protein